jgi:hypothetical protein
MPRRLLQQPHPNRKFSAPPSVRQSQTILLPRDRPSLPPLPYYYLAVHLPFFRHTLDFIYSPFPWHSWHIFSSYPSQLSQTFPFLTYHFFQPATSFHLWLLPSPRCLFVMDPFPLDTIHILSSHTPRPFYTLFTPHLFSPLLHLFSSFSYRNLRNTIAGSSSSFANNSYIQPSTTPYPLQLHLLSTSERIYSIFNSTTDPIHLISPRRLTTLT